VKIYHVSWKKKQEESAPLIQALLDCCT